LPKKSLAALIPFLEHFSTEDACREYLAKILWGGKPKCPHCNSKHIYTIHNRPAFTCGNCAKQFRATTGTIFENSKIPLTKWFLATRLMACSKKGISSHQLGKELGITQKSAWYMEQNIRLMLGNRRYEKMLDGIIEVDETYIGGRRKGGKRGRGTEKAKVFGMLQRNGEIRIMHVEDVSSYTLHPLIFGNVKLGSVIMSDEWKAYNGLKGKYKRGVINHGKRHYADGEIHVNSLEGAWGLFKRSLKGIYHRPSNRYMFGYCAEFEFRYNNRKKSIPLIFSTAIRQSKIRMTHQQITK